MTSITGGGAFHRVQNLLDANTARISDSMQRLASGKAVITPGDRASQVAIGNGIRSQLATLKVGVQNGTEAMQALEMANEDVGSLSDMVIRLEELNALGENGLNTTEDVLAIKAEANEILKEFALVQTRAKWKGNSMLNVSAGLGQKVSFGQNDAADVLNMHLGKNILVASIGISGSVTAAASGATAVTASTVSVGTANTASAALNSSLGLAKMKGMVDALQVAGGGLYNRVSNTLDHMSSLKAGYALDLSSKEDVDFAAETTQLAKGQILAQAGTAMLAQSNSQGQGMLQLIQ